MTHIKTPLAWSLQPTLFIAVQSANIFLVHLLMTGSHFSSVSIHMQL